MATVINPSKEELHDLSSEEAFAYFDQMVRQFLGVSAEDFLKDRKKFESNPHFASIEFLIPLVDDSEE